MDDEKYKARMRRHDQRVSRERQAYVARQYGKDLIVWKSLCALHQQERIEKNEMRFITMTDMVWLLAMKQYCVSSGSDDFYIAEVRRFMNQSFKKSVSRMTGSNIEINLIKSGYIRRQQTINGKKGRLILTMKARAFYRDLSELFSI